MRRALNVRDILNKKYDRPRRKWKDAFDTPEVRGRWFVWGNSGNGKTSFSDAVISELCKYDRVAFNSLEEGTSLTVRGQPAALWYGEVSRHLSVHQGGHPHLEDQAPAS